jgi:hypothetical protein
MLNELHVAQREELLDYRVWRQHYLALLHLHRRPTRRTISSMYSSSSSSVITRTREVALVDTRPGHVRKLRVTCLALILRPREERNEKKASEREKRPYSSVA